MQNRINDSRIIFGAIIFLNIMITALKFETIPLVIISFMFLSFSFYLYENYIKSVINYVNEKEIMATKLNQETQNKINEQKKYFEELAELEKKTLKNARADLEILHQYYYNLFASLLGKKTNQETKLLQSKLGLL